MTTYPFNLQVTDPSWHACLNRGLSQLDPMYLQSLTQSNHWLPGSENIFNAFTLPLSNVRYVLFGESPYPRHASANGYAFWDAAVNALWSPTGMSKAVNRATSMRNILKMLLVADGVLDAKQASQDAIAKIDKSSMIQTNDAFFARLLEEGFLLLNATPVLQDGPPQKDARAWQPFMRELLYSLLEQQPKTKLILLGKIAINIDTLLPDSPIDKLYAEHPYNLSFITNPTILEFFRPLHLLRSK